MVVDISCEDHSALVSWSPSPIAEAYHAVAVAADGHEHTCNTTSSNCSMSELHCDQRYTVFVVASHENCTSKASQNATANTGTSRWESCSCIYEMNGLHLNSTFCLGPCKPSELSVTLHCDNQSAVLTWTPSDDAEEYYGFAQAENGDMLYCHSTEPSCTINELVCGAVYNFSVQASDGTCNSSFSDPVRIAGGASPACCCS